MKYNTQRKPLVLPEYGRIIQNMVDHALTIEDRAERQRCAYTIISIMGWMSPQHRDMPDYQRKLWDHLAIMSDFKLDIDYPFEVVKEDHMDSRPEPIPLHSTRIRYRHYGRATETLIQRAAEMPEGDEKQNLVALIGNHLRKDYLTWNKDTVDEKKIAEDLATLSDGRLQLTPEISRLMARRMANAHRRPQPNNNGGGRKNGRGKRRNK